MAQFDVYPNPNSDTAEQVPYLLDVQADLLDIMSTRIVIPLYTPQAIPKPIRHLNPLASINGDRFVCSTAELAGIPVSMLHHPITNLAENRDEIIAALDFIYTGI